MDQGFKLTFQLRGATTALVKDEELEEKLNPIINPGVFGDKSDSKDKMTIKEEGGLPVQKFSGSGNAIKLIGFEDIDGEMDEKKKAHLRLTVDKDTPMVILPPKPIIVAPVIIRNTKRHNKWRHGLFAFNRLGHVLF